MLNLHNQWKKKMLILHKAYQMTRMKIVKKGSYHNIFFCHEAFFPFNANQLVEVLMDATVASGHPSCFAINTFNIDREIARIEEKHFCSRLWIIDHRLLTTQ